MSYFFPHLFNLYYFLHVKNNMVSRCLKKIHICLYLYDGIQLLTNRLYISDLLNPLIIFFYCIIYLITNNSRPRPRSSDIVSLLSRPCLANRVHPLRSKYVKTAICEMNENRSSFKRGQTKMLQDASDYKSANFETWSASRVIFDINITR